jgi:L-glutamine-phosphate cytidylyltransferase
VSSDETIAAAERFLVARFGKVSDGIHSSFNRRLCRPAVRWLTHTPVTPNAVTFGGVIVSIFAAFAFAPGTYWSFVIGALLFFIAGLFDEIDGMLARIKFADSPFGTCLESFGDSLSYVLLFVGITVGLYRQHVVRELWVGAALLIGTVLALVATTLQRKRAASADCPTEYLGNFYRKREQDSSNWISRAVRQTQGFQRRGIMIHYVVLLTVLGEAPVIFYLATLGSHPTWTLALYYNHRFFKSAAPRISLNEIHASQEALLKAVILAAGQGTRIRAVHGECPKCLIKVNDKTILDHQIDGLVRAGIEQIAIVVGYEKQQIIRHVHGRIGRSWTPRIEFIENPAFAITNNIYALWLARDWIGGDGFVCVNADVILDAQILASAMKTNALVSMMVDPEWRDETMKVIISDGRVVRMSKKISKQEFSGTYIGITLFHQAINARFFAKMEEVVKAGRVNEFFNVAVQELVDEGLRVGYTTTAGAAWAEIDDPLDVARCGLEY